MKEELLTQIRQCPNLPSLPAIAMEVLNLAQSDEVDIAEIARIISRDPALSGKILRTVNSSFYGRSQSVSQVSHALVILGLQSVKTLVLGFSLVGNLQKQKSKGFNHLDYWRRSIYAATAGSTLVNGNFSITDPTSSTFGWTSRGEVSVAGRNRHSVNTPRASAARPQITATAIDRFFP